MKPKATVISIGGDLPAEQVLRAAVEADFDQVMIIGWMKERTPDGRFYVSSSDMTHEGCVYACEAAKKLILETNEVEV